MTGEGELAFIERLRARLAKPPPGQTWVGDDCAVLADGRLIATDLLVEGVHFRSAWAGPADIGFKALAVNLSDLAACGARPTAFMLALAMPRVEEDFLEGFARGMFALADRHGCELVGGDTTRGPLAICITVFGEVARESALLRSGARAGDDVWVSGTLGDARLALEVFRGTLSLAEPDFAQARQAMEMPEPRVGLGLALRGLASSAIDVSDGLAGDLAHVLRRSGVGAVVDIDALPSSAVLAACPASIRRECLLSGGDDYELVFTAPAELRADVIAAGASTSVRVTRIGSVDGGSGLRFVDGDGRAQPYEIASFDHFRS